jgi:hypothetical protein
MTDWMVEHWVVEGMGTICAALLLVYIVIKLAELMDRDQ